MWRMFTIWISVSCWVWLPSKMCSVSWVASILPLSIILEFGFCSDQNCYILSFRNAQYPFNTPTKSVWKFQVNLSKSRKASSSSKLCSWGQFQQGHFSTGKGNQSLWKIFKRLKKDPGNKLYDFWARFSTLKSTPGSIFNVKYDPRVNFSTWVNILRYTSIFPCLLIFCACRNRVWQVLTSIYNQLQDFSQFELL